MKTTAEVAAMLGVSESAIIARAKRRKIEPARFGLRAFAWTPQQIEALRVKRKPGRKTNAK